jgi:pilus assembly protein CpaB
MSIKGMTLAKGGNRLPLILGVVLGLVAAVLVVVVLTGSKDSGSIPISSGEGVPVVVATSDIPAGTKLNGDLIEVRQIPASDKLASAFGTTEGVVDQVTKIPLAAGEQVIPNKLATGNFGSFVGDNPPLALVVEPGQRAVSVGISSVIGAGGNIRPGDFVDVVLIVELKPEDVSPESQGTSDQIGATILQNVKVLAIDQSITNPNAETTSDPSQGKSADEAATTLTLQVTPTQGEVLSMAEVCGNNHGGRITVSLRAAGDTSPLTHRPTWSEGGPPPRCSEILGIAALGE